MILLAMIFMHIVDDYYLQGVLAKMKQRSWWKENAPDEMYEDDWLVALIMHAFSWTFCIMLPIFLAVDFYINGYTLLLFGANVVVHAITDHFKANAKKINLVTDQTIHIMQILITLIWAIIIYR
jgi:hypothetical protein